MAMPTADDFAFNRKMIEHAKDNKTIDRLERELDRARKCIVKLKESLAAKQEELERVRDELALLVSHLNTLVE